MVYKVLQSLAHWHLSDLIHYSLPCSLFSNDAGLPAVYL